MIGALGMPELLVILVVIILIWGPKQIPRLCKMVGDGVKELRKAGED